MARMVAVACVVAVALASCYRDESNLTETGKGKPEVVLDFPASVAASSTHSLDVTITNPGPGDMTSTLVTFSLVGGATQSGGVTNPVVGLGSNGSNPSIAGVDPRPERVSADGVVFHFPGLDEGESTTITFDIVVPSREGPASNSVIVSDGQELDRARGVLLRTTVED